MNTAVPVQFKVQRTNTIVVVILLKTTKQKEDKKKVRTNDDACTFASSKLIFSPRHALYIYNMLHADAGLPATVNRMRSPKLATSNSRIKPS